MKYSILFFIFLLLIPSSLAIIGTDGTNSVEFNIQDLSGVSDNNTFISSGSLGNSSSSYVFFNMITTDLNQKPTANVSVYDDQGNLETTFSGEVTDTMVVSLQNISERVNFTFKKYNGLTLLEEISQVIESSYNYSNFTLENYSQYSYEITLNDSDGSLNTYTDTIQAVNLKPNITGYSAYNDGTIGTCRRDSPCFVRYQLKEDGCSLTPNLQNTIIKNPLGATVVNSNTHTLVSEDNDLNCEIQTITFTPVDIGTFTIDFNYTDNQGLSDLLSTTLLVGESSGGGGSTPTGGGGGGGGTTIIVSDEDIKLEITPAVEDVAAFVDREVNKDFSIKNVGDSAVDVDIIIVENEISSSWISLGGTDVRSQTINIPAPGGLDSNEKFIRYSINVPVGTSEGLYTNEILIKAGDLEQVFTININVRSSIFAEILAVLDRNIFSIDRDVCTSGFSTAGTCEETTKIQFAFKWLYLVYILVFVLFIILLNIFSDEFRKLPIIRGFFGKK